MWQSVLEICSEVGETNGINLVDDVRRELMIRQSFHVFEMMTTADKRLLIELRAELRKIGLYQHPFPAALYWLVRLLGPHAKAFFDLSRKLMQ